MQARPSGGCWNVYASRHPLTRPRPRASQCRPAFHAASPAETENMTGRIGTILARRLRAGGTVCSTCPPSNSGGCIDLCRFCFALCFKSDAPPTLPASATSMSVERLAGGAQATGRGWLVTVDPPVPVPRGINRRPTWRRTQICCVGRQRIADTGADHWAQRRAGGQISARWSPRKKRYSTSCASCPAS